MRRLLVLLAVLVSARSAAAQTFSEAFEVSNGTQYGFTAFATPAIPSGYSITHLPTGGFDGTGGAQITVNGCTTDCNTATNQGNIGWGQTMGGTYSVGDSFFLRFRIKMLTAYGEAGNAKFMIRGSVSAERFMLHMAKPFNTNIACRPNGEGGGDYYGSGGGLPADTDPTNAYIQATDYGLASSFLTLAGGVSTNRSDYALLIPTINIGSNCAAFVVLPNKNAVADIKPQNNAAISDNGWVSYQIQATSGACGAADYRVWANNNVQASPTTQMIDMNIVGGLCDMGVTGWEGAMSIGGFWGMADTQAISFILDDVQVGTSFDSSYYRVQSGGGGPTKYRLRFRVLLDEGLQFLAIGGSIAAVLALRRRRTDEA